MDVVADLPDPNQALEAEEAALTAEGQARFSRKDYAGALPRFEALCKLRPAQALFADRFAHCLTELRRWTEARHAWWLAIETHGRTAGRVTNLARSMIETQDYAAAAAFLAGNRDGLPANPDLLVFSAVAALSDGDFDTALDFARRLETLGVAKTPYALTSLAAHLGRLARLGWPAEVMALLGALLPIFSNQDRMLQAGFSAAGLQRLWDVQLRCARDMIRKAPHEPDGYVHEVEALCATGQQDKCGDQIVNLRRRFPPGRLTPEQEQRVAAVAELAPSRAAWAGILADMADAESFQAANFRVVAHITLRQYEPARAAAAAARRQFPGQERFMLLLGRCHDLCGDLAAAQEWMEKAAASDTAATDTLAHLFKIQLKAGARDAAFVTAGRIFARHPAMPLALSLFKALGREPEVAEMPAPAPPDTGLTWLHGGDSGDVIYALAAMQAGGGGHLYLSAIDDTREPMADAKRGFLAPLLAAQPYISGFGPWQGEAVAKDFTLFRHLMRPDVDLATQHWHCVSDDAAPDVSRPWLSVPDAPRHGRPVFARSGRYRNPGWDGFWQVLKAAAPDALFIGTAAEHAEFGHGEHVAAADALELASVIAGASVFVGNQSLPYALAEGLKVGRLQEVSPLVPNCVFPGALALRLGGWAAPAPEMAVAGTRPEAFTGSRSALTVGWKPLAAS